MSEHAVFYYLLILYVILTTIRLKFVQYSSLQEKKIFLMTRFLFAAITVAVHLVYSCDQIAFLESI